MNISVVIPAFNCSDFLPETVESICQSGLSPFEILIVNDGSTDQTETIALQLQNQHQEVRVISQPNSGVSAARNRGIQEAEGDYILFVDSDDSLLPGSLSSASEILNAEHPDMLMFGMSFDYYKSGKKYRSDALCYPFRGIMTAVEWAQEFEDLYAYNMLSPVWNKIIRRDLIVNHQVAFRTDMIEMEDYLFSVQCLMHCNHIYLLDQVVYQYRQTEDERGTFNRLWRIPSLSAYMHPFYEIATELEVRFPNCKATVVTDQIYAMLFHEQLRFATQEQIKLAARDMLSGPYADVIASTDAELYQKLRNQQYARVWRERAISRARHQIAVQVKFRKSMRSQK